MSETKPIRFLLALVLVASVVPGVLAQATPSAEDVAAALQRKYDTIRDFSANFVHTHEGGVLKRKREERGTLYVKKPGKMRWDYN